jgi:hypothetical protein
MPDLVDVHVGEPHTAAHNEERHAINALQDAIADIPPVPFASKICNPRDPFYGGPDALDYMGTGIDNYQSAIENAYEDAAANFGKVVIDYPLGATGKIKQYGGHSVEQLALPKHMATGFEVLEPGIHALEDTFWYQHSDGSDGSGSANDNAGVIHGLHIDGRGIVAHTDGLFVSDAAQSTINDLSVTGFVDIGVNFGRAQNLNLWNMQIQGPGRGLYFRPLVAGQQGPGHIIIYGGHIHDCYLPIHVEAWTPDVAGPIGYAHDITFNQTIVETGRLAGMPVRVAALIECGIVTFTDVNFTYGAQVGVGGNNVEEDCLILVDNPHYSGYSTVVNIQGANTTIGGGTNRVTDAVRVKQTGSANIISFGPSVGIANVDNAVCVDGINGVTTDPILNGMLNIRQITPPIVPIRKINGATLLNTYNKATVGNLFEKPAGLNNGEIGNPFSIQWNGEGGPRHSVDWQTTYRWTKREAVTGLNPAPAGTQIASIIRSGDANVLGGRWGVLNGWYRFPAAKTVVTADQTLTVNWATTNVHKIGFTVNSKTITSFAFGATTPSIPAGGPAVDLIPTDGQQIQLWVNCAAGITGCSVVWAGSQIQWDPDLGPVQPITGYDQSVDLSYSADTAKWIETGRSHIPVGGGAPSGAAGGVLSGTYPNPGIANDVALLGNPTAPTQSAGNNSTRIANTAFVKGEIDALKGGVSTAYDTLVEIVAQMTSDESVVTGILSTLGTKASLTGVETLTNKRITKRVSATASTATLTIDSDSYDCAKITAQSVPLTIANPTGTPTGMQGLTIRLKDNGTARAITYGTQFRAFGIALPTATTVGKTTYLGCFWNSDDSKWDVVAVNTEL